MKNMCIRMCLASLAILLGLSTPSFAEIKILVVPKGTMTEYWSIVARGARDAGKDLGVKVTYRGPRSEDQHDAQIKIIAYGIHQNYDAIVLAPNHEQMIVPIAKKASDKGIPIVLIDSSMNCSCQSSFVESDNYDAGQKAARQAASLLGGTGNIVLVRFQENHASTSSRENGFLDALHKDYPQIRILAEPRGGVSSGSAYHAVSRILDNFSDIDLLFSVNESTTVGALRALRERNLQGKIKHIGFDFNPVLSAAIRNHEMHAIIIQNPYKIGYTGVKMAYDRIHGKPIPAIIHTETTLITAENYNSSEVQDVIQANAVQEE